jgi:hypothetical protein
MFFTLFCTGRASTIDIFPYFPDMPLVAFRWVYEEAISRLLVGRL